MEGDDRALHRLEMRPDIAGITAMQMAREQEIDVAFLHDGQRFFRAPDDHPFRSRSGWRDEGMMRDDDFENLGAGTAKLQAEVL